MDTLDSLRRSVLNVLNQSPEQSLYFYQIVNKAAYNCKSISRKNRDVQMVLSQLISDNRVIVTRQMGERGPLMYAVPRPKENDRQPEIKTKSVPSEETVTLHKQPTIDAWISSAGQTLHDSSSKPSRMVWIPKRGDTGVLNLESHVDNDNKSRQWMENTVAATFGVIDRGHFSRENTMDINDLRGEFDRVREMAGFANVWEMLGFLSDCGYIRLVLAPVKRETQ